MTIRELQGEVLDKIPVKTVLLSVNNKKGLDTFVPGLISACPEVRFISTGGTFTELAKILLATGNEYRLRDVEKYTGFPEMEGGLVKTLHPKIHAGLLGERNNPKHQQYLADMDAVFIDMVVVNLYPFSKVVEEIASGKIDPRTEQVGNFETARGNIDIGGPAMLRAGAKNFMSCAAVCDPEDYSYVLSEIRDTQGNTTFTTRLGLAQKVFETTRNYDAAISKYLNYANFLDVKGIYRFSE